jgi:hypothetical protein
MTDASLRRTVELLEEFFIDSHRDPAEHIVATDEERSITLILEPSQGERSPRITLDLSEPLETRGELETALWLWNEYIRAGGR